MSVTLLDDEPALGAFSVKLPVFEGPFDLLLQLITRHKLDITEVSLSMVTDDFIAYVRQLQTAADLRKGMDQVSQFLVVAATLLDLKAARLLPQGEVEDEEDLAALQARDLLFVRLLQYRAFKIVAGQLGERLDAQAKQRPHPGGLEERFTKLLPEIDLTGLADQLALLAARALIPKEPEKVTLTHMHVPKVSVREQADLLAGRLRRKKKLSFRALISDAPDTLVVVGRFLALLELFRGDFITFEQLHPLAELTVNWVGQDFEGLESDFDDETPVTEAQEETDA
ncbi:MAG: segregation/condensation protein A [Propionibacteriaceae bacterium]|jgi:segregation and condensation protein A|nr:segregation/condensation protein A [Propionibacteriaceae bacterium]